MYNPREQQGKVLKANFLNIQPIWALNKGMELLANFLHCFLIKFIHNYQNTIVQAIYTVQSDTHTQLHRYNYSYYLLPMILSLQHLHRRNCNAQLTVLYYFASRMHYVSIWIKPRPCLLIVRPKLKYMESILKRQINLNIWVSNCRMHV